MKKMDRKYLFPIALLISLLIILIPVAVATEIESYDTLILKTSEQRIKLLQSTDDETSAPISADREPGERGYLSDPGKACVAQHEETSSFADSLDNSIISTLEQIATALFTICTVTTAIDTVVNTVSLAIGMISGDFCCPAAVVEAGGAACVTAATEWSAWSIPFEFIKPLCCFVNCGWCTGAECWGAIFPIHLGKIGDLGFFGPGAGIAQVGLSPYDNIYTAVGCLCPIAVIFNLRKLKTIYDVYDCCIQEACENSLSTEACERQLDEATCMYWEGSFYSMLARILMSFLAAKLLDPIIKQLAENAFMDKFLACLYAGMKIYQAIGVIGGVMSAWEYMGRTFDEPNCEDLGFDRIKEQSEAAMQEAAEEGFEDVDESLLENWKLITMVDQDNDGIYDYSSPQWKKTGEGKWETTIRSLDEKTGEHVTEIYSKTKEKGKLLSTITNQKGEEISRWKWPEISGSHEAPRLKVFPDGSASIGKTTGTFDITGNEMIFEYTAKDEEGKETKIKEIFTDPKLIEGKIGDTGLNFDDFDYFKDEKLVAGEEGKAGKELSIETNKETKKGKITITTTDEKGKLGEPKTTEWTSDKTAKEAAEEKETKEEKTLAQETSEDEIASDAMYEVAWTLLDVTLGETINDLVKDQCEEDYKASYPPSDTPADSGTEEPGECGGENIFNAQFIEKTESDTTCEYKVSYSIKICKAPLSYSITLIGPSAEETIESGKLGLQQTISRNRIVESALCTHQSICIKAEGFNQCYPHYP